MIANIDVTNCLIDLDNYKDSKGIYYNLKNHFKYYIKMNAWQKYITKLNLKVYNVNKSPFSSIIVYKCDYDYFNTSECKHESQKIKFKKKNDRYEGTFEKKNTLNKHIFLFLEIIPEYDIQYMVAETTITEYFGVNIFALVLIIILIIILVLMILYIINHYKKCLSKTTKNVSSTNLASNNQNETELISKQ